MITLFLTALALSVQIRPAVADGYIKHRLIVISDIGGDPDDQQSVVRLLTYANDFDIEALVATSRGLNGHDIRPDLMRRTIEAYGLVQPNLLLHDPNFPSPEFLLSKVKNGNPTPGIDGVINGPDTEASEEIISAVDRDDPRPVWVVIWGGSTDLARALFKVRASRTSAELAVFASRIRVYAIGDQDGVGAYIRKEFPDIFFIHAATSSAPLYNGTPRGMYQNKSNGIKIVKDSKLVSASWAVRNVIEGHGALGALYPLNAVQNPSTSMGVKEGDTPSFLYLLSSSIGLSDSENPSWGSWGGRFSGQVHFSNARDEHWSGAQVKDLQEKWTVARFRSSYQADFAARMDWCVKDYSHANHRPLAVVSQDPGSSHLLVSASSGEQVVLSAEGSSDPDGNALGYRWFVYKEAGNLRSMIRLIHSHSKATQFRAPVVATRKDLHIVLEVSDDGAPSLKHYRRIIVSIYPKS
jgi:hypothetical protein